MPMPDLHVHTQLGGVRAGLETGSGRLAGSPGPMVRRFLAVMSPHYGGGFLRSGARRPSATLCLPISKRALRTPPVRAGLHSSHVHRQGDAIGLRPIGQGMCAFSCKSVREQIGHAPRWLVAVLLGRPNMSETASSYQASYDQTRAVASDWNDDMVQSAISMLWSLQGTSALNRAFSSHAAAAIDALTDILLERQQCPVAWQRVR